MRWVVFLIIFFTLSQRVGAQGFTSDSIRHFRLEFTFGGGSIASYDNFGSPLPYSGITLPVGGAVEYVTPTVRHSLELTSITSLANAAPLHNQYSSEIEYAFEDLRYRFSHYLRDIGTTGIQVSIGGEWENSLFARAYDYSGDFSSGSGSGEASSSLAAAADLSYQLGDDHLFRVSLSLPIVAVVLRPAYGYVNGDASFFQVPFDVRIEPIGVMWSWRFGLDYDYILSKYLVLGLHYHELYYKYPFFIWKGIGAESDALLNLAWRFDL